MDKEEFLEIYPQIDGELIERYLKAMKEQDMPSIHMYSAEILTQSGVQDTFHVHVLAKNVEDLLDEYGIDYRYKG